MFLSSEFHSKPVPDPVVGDAQGDKRFSQCVGAGEAEGLHVGENIKLLECAADRIGEDSPGEMGHIDAMARVTLAVEDIRRQTAHLGHPVEWHTNRAAPRIIDAHVGQLRIYAGHPRAQLTLDFSGVIPKIVASAAKQQALVSTQAIIFQDEIGGRIPQRPAD